MSVSKGINRQSSKGCSGHPLLPNMPRKPDPRPYDDEMFVFRLERERHAEGSKKGRRKPNKGKRSRRKQDAISFDVPGPGLQDHSSHSEHSNVDVTDDAQNPSNFPHNDLLEWPALQNISLDPFLATPGGQEQLRYRVDLGNPVSPAYTYDEEGTMVNKPMELEPVLQVDGKPVQTSISGYLEPQSTRSRSLSVLSSWSPRDVQHDDTTSPYASGVLSSRGEELTLLIPPQVAVVQSNSSTLVSTNLSPYVHTPALPTFTQNATPITPQNCASLDFTDYNEIASHELEPTNVASQHTRYEIVISNSEETYKQIHIVPAHGPSQNRRVGALFCCNVCGSVFNMYDPSFHYFNGRPLSGFKEATEHQMHWQIRTMGTSGCTTKAGLVTEGWILTTASLQGEWNCVDMVCPCCEKLGLHTQIRVTSSFEAD